VILCTRRALIVGAAIALLALLGFWVSWAPQAVLVADVLLIGLVWLDARLAPNPTRRRPPPRRFSAPWWLGLAFVTVTIYLLILTVTALFRDALVALPFAIEVGEVVFAVLSIWGVERLLQRPRPATDLSVARDAAPAFSLGHGASVAYRWHNGAPRRARLRIREVRPDLLGGLQPPRWLDVPSGGTARETLPVVPQHRGRAEAGAFVVDSTGPLGLGRRRGWIAAPWRVVVYPPMVTMRLRASVAQSMRRREWGRRPERQLGEGRLFESLREWVPGDDPRYIDWKATARRRKPITRQYEAERRQQVLLVMDTGRLLTADVAGVARLDFAVQAALELAYAAAQHDDNVGVMAFADGVQHFVTPQRGRTGLKLVLDVLAVLEASLVEPDYPGAFRYLAARNRKRALTVVFTDVIDRFASEALVANVARLRPRHLPIAVTLRNRELDGLAASRPATVRDAYRKAAAEELLRARDEALGHMRRAGVIVLDVPPERAAQAVVGRYLELKRRGRL
jgi:uncharacterized protein (DUF58 family)